VTVPTPATPDALAPLRRALLGAAHDDAAALRADAEADAERAAAEAAQRAAAVHAEARRRGAADGADRVTAERAAARREARAVLLRAQQAAYDRVREAAVLAVAEELSDPVARGRLQSLVLDALGPDARLTDAPGGGLVGEAPDGRRVDGSAGQLVDLAMADLDVEGLWAP
jgi:signal transduction histidine kinase